MAQALMNAMGHAGSGRNAQERTFNGFFNNAGRLPTSKEGLRRHLKEEESALHLIGPIPISPTNKTGRKCL